MIRKIILITMLACTGCVSNSPSEATITAAKPAANINREQQHQLLIGKWYGAQPTKDGGFRQTLIEKKGDGSYVVTFRVKSAEGRVEESREAGEWGVSGSIYFTIFKGWIRDNRLYPSESSDPYNYDAYQIIKLTDSEFEYVNAETRNHFFSKKVGDDFKFPAI